MSSEVSTRIPSDSLSCKPGLSRSTAVLPKAAVAPFLLPRSPTIAEAAPNSGVRQPEQPEPLRGNQSSSGIQRGNNPMQRFCYAPKTSPVEQSSDIGEPQPHHTRGEHVPNVAGEPKPAPLTPRGLQPSNPCTPQMLFSSIPTGKGRTWPHSITAAPSFAMDF